MEKKWNKWLIIGGILFVLLFTPITIWLTPTVKEGVRVVSPILIINLIIVPISALLISIGIINYTKWKLWIRILIIIILTAVIGYLLSWIISFLAIFFTESF